MEKGASSDHSDAVTDVAYSPKKPVLITGCLDCKTRLFTARPLPAHIVPKGGIPGIVKEWDKNIVPEVAEKQETMKIMGKEEIKELEI